MDWQTIVFEVIDMRSFSNLWYWIGLAVMWSTASHWVLGVPFDMITRARRHGGALMEDLNLLARINANRLDFIANVSGLIMTTSLFFLVTSLALLGFAFRIEFAQAVFLLMLPMVVVFGISIRSARIVRENHLEGEALCKHLTRHRMFIQGIGVISIFVTALWGMYQNLSHGLMMN